LDFEALLILLFVLAPLLERLFKAGKQEPPKPPPRSRPVPQPRPRVEPTRPAPPPSSQDMGADDAVDILPEDLWKILTGQQPLPQPKPRPLPQAERAPVPPAREPWQEAAPLELPDSFDEHVAAETSRVPARRTADDLSVVHVPPQVVSLEALEIDDEARHEAFHARLARRTTSPDSQVERRERQHRFMTDAELRRAIVMAEVLGPPRGLE